MNSEEKTIEVHGDYAIRWWWYDQHKSVLDFEVCLSCGDGHFHDDDSGMVVDRWPEGGHEWHGDIKWDGCANIAIRDSGCMAHFCHGLRPLAEIAEAVDRIAMREFGSLTNSREHWRHNNEWSIQNAQ